MAWHFIPTEMDLVMGLESKIITKYNSEIHHRRSVRLKGYDYSRSGFYFVTICVQNQLCLFGNIENENMVLDDAGLMVQAVWQELKHKYGNIKLHEQIIMPNHFHGVIEIVGANHVSPDGKIVEKGEHIGSPLHVMIQWFKTMSTNKYIRGVKNENWKPFDKKLWQRNYYEHIIRNEESYHQISRYIYTNPMKWQEDKYFV